MANKAANPGKTITKGGGSKEKELASLTVNDRLIMEAVRNNEGASQSKVAEISGVAPSTTESAIDKLVKAGMLIKTEKKGYHIQKKHSAFIGVSIGSSHISAAVVDLSFRYISIHQIEKRLTTTSVYHPNRPSDAKPQGFWAKYHFRLASDTADCPPCLQTDAEKSPYAVWRADTRNQPLDVCQIVNDLCCFAIELKKGGLNVASIGFAFPGSVDANTNQIIECTKKNFSIENTDARELPLTETVAQLDAQNIKLFLDNHAASCTNAELYSNEGCLKDQTENTAVVYMGGSGFAISFFLNGKIYRGKTCLSGTNWGHQPIKFGSYTAEDHCYCGKDGCFEQKIRSLFEDGEYIQNHSGREIASYLNEKECIEKEIIEKRVVKKGIVVKEIIENTVVKEDRTETEENQLTTKQRFVEYLWRAIYPTVSLLQIEHCVFTGKLADLFRDALQAEFKNRLFPIKNRPVVSVSALGLFAPVTGMAISGFFRLSDR